MMNIFALCTIKPPEQLQIGYIYKWITDRQTLGWMLCDNGDRAARRETSADVDGYVEWEWDRKWKKRTTIKTYTRAKKSALDKHHNDLTTSLSWAGARMRTHFRSLVITNTRIVIMDTCNEGIIWKKWLLNRHTDANITNGFYTISPD